MLLNEPIRHVVIRNWSLTNLIEEDEQHYAHYQTRNRFEDEAINAGLQAREYIANGDVVAAAETARLAAGWAGMAANMTEMFRI